MIHDSRHQTTPSPPPAFSLQQTGAARSRGISSMWSHSPHRLGSALSAINPRKEKKNQTFLEAQIQESHQSNKFEDRNQPSREKTWTASKAPPWRPAATPLAGPHRRRRRPARSGRPPPAPSGMQRPERRRRRLRRTGNSARRNAGCRTWRAGRPAAGSASWTTTPSSSGPLVARGARVLHRRDRAAPPPSIGGAAAAAESEFGDFVVDFPALWIGGKGLSLGSTSGAHAKGLRGFIFIDYFILS